VGKSSKNKFHIKLKRCAPLEYYSRLVMKETDGIAKVQLKIELCVYKGRIIRQVKLRFGAEITARKYARRR
jgi:hypothetical protein